MLQVKRFVKPTPLKQLRISNLAHLSNAEIEIGYNNQVSIVSQADAEAGTSMLAERWTAQRVGQAIAALGGGSNNLDGGRSDSNYGGIVAIDGGSSA